jgi:hypothetical protein
MIKVFKSTGEDFSGITQAESWLKDNGYSFGSMQRSNPIGVVKGDAYISKWFNMTPNDKLSLDGTLTGDYRNGDVTLTLKD